MIKVQRHSVAVTAHVRESNPLKVLAGDLAASEERYRALFETMPLGVIHYNADGSVAGANPAACEILGIDLAKVESWPFFQKGVIFHEDGSPFPPEEVPVRVALRTGEIVAATVVGIRHAKTGELRWVRATAVPDARDERGRPSRAYAVLTDLTEQRQAETALRQRNALLGRLQETNVLGLAVIDGERIYEANDAYLDIIGYSRDDLEAGRIDWREMTPPEWDDVHNEAVRQVREYGACQPFEKEYLHKDGHRVPVLVGAATISRDPVRWASFVVDLSARQRAERERAGLLARERTSRAEADSARERLAFLMRAGALVAATRDRDELLDQVTRLVVPSLADFCVIFLPTPDGMLRASSVNHRSPGRAKLLSALRDHPVSSAGPLLVQRAYTAGTTQLARDITAKCPPGPSPSPGRWASCSSSMRVARSPHHCSAPVARSAPFMLGRGARRARFTEADVQVVEELGRRMSAGLANVDEFAREHAIAETLQRALLSDALPRPPGLEIAVRYLPATEGAEVGGDWYDAFPVEGDKVGLVMGDVAGHSIASASVMGQVRSLLRAYAVEELGPARVLERINTALARLLPDVLASVVYVVLDPATGELSYANAGHPPPLIVTGDGRAEYLDDTTGPMLGACAEASYTTGRRLIKPGGRILLYTDGLIEDRHRDITEGSRSWRKPCAAPHPAQPGRHAPR